MRAYDFILFLALLGAVNSSLDYMYQSDFSDNWFGTHTESWDMEMIEIDSDTIDNFDEGSVVNQNEQDSFISNIMSLSGVIVDSIRMLYHLDDYVLDKIFFVPDPENPEVNLFAPINDVIMVGIYVVIAFGIYQVKSKTSTKHYE